MPNRRHFLKSNLAGLTGMTLFSPFLFHTMSCNLSENLSAIVKSIGEEKDDKIRYERLLKLMDSPELSQKEKEDLEVLMIYVDHWANGKELYEGIHSDREKPRRYLSSYFSGKVAPDTYLMPQLSEDELLYPLISFYRARMLVSECLEHGHIQKHEDVRNAYLGEAVTLLEKAQKAFPNNPIIGMYLGKHIPWEADFDPDPLAPQWANAQREVLEKLTTILHWWIDHRQMADGQYGGGWGDDVEMWRKWLPILVGFKDEKVNQAQEKLSKGLFALDRMREGYTDRIFDVEHTAEDSADTCTAMMHISPHDPVWKERALRLIELMETFWTGRNERGFLQFKSTYFSSKEVDPDPRKACDTVYHPRTIQPALLYWQRTEEGSIEKIILDWMDTWVEASMREENGKAAGIVPSAIHWPSGSIGGTTETWWDPGNHTADPLYVWPSAMSMMLNTMLLAFYKSGNEHYLKPIFSMADIYRQYLKNPNNGEIGSTAWCASKMGNFLPDVLTKYRKIIGDTRFDELLLQTAEGYNHYFMSGKTDRLEEKLHEQQAAFSKNWPAFTSEVTWTDRVFRFAAGYYNHMHEEKLFSYDANFLFSMVSGNIGNALYFPVNAVRWLTPAKEIAVWVQKATTNFFQAEIYHFGSIARKLSCELFLLRPDEYQLKILKSDTEELIYEEQISFQTGNILEFEIPERRGCRLIIE